MLNSFFSGAGFGLSEKQIKDVELAVLLLASAEKVSKQQFDQASKIVKLGDVLSPNNGRSVQRMAHLFSKALREKIDRETGATTSKIRESKRAEQLLSDENTPCLKPVSVDGYHMLPFVQVSLFTGIQVIVEHVASARKVHYIDLAIKCGVQCTVLMQALADRNEVPLDLLKVTVIGITTEEKRIEEIGKRLSCFAESLNIPFSFKTALLTHLKDINEDIFEIEDGEVLAFYSSAVLRHIVGQPDCLEAPIGVLKNLNPGVMVVIECEANHFSPIFMERCSEALSYFGSLFDCFEEYLDQSVQDKITFAATYFGPEIQNIVAAEDDNKIFGHLKINDWRNCLLNLD